MIRKYLNVFVGLIVIILLTVVFINVADKYKKDKISEDEKNADDAEETTIDIWYTYKGYESYLKELAAQYEKECGCKVRLTYYTSINYLDKISEASKNGNGPDLFIVSSEHLQNAVLLGIAEQNNYPDIFTTDNFYTKAIDNMTYLNKKYGYPLGFDTSVLLYNKKFVNTVPTSFDEIEEFANNFNNTEEDTNQEFANIEAILRWDVSDFMYNYGFFGSYFSIGGSYGDDPKELSMNNDNAIAAGEYYKSLSQYFYAEISSSNYLLIIDDFLNEKIVYTIASSDIISKLSDREEAIGMMILPSLTNELDTSAISVTDLAIVNPFGDMKDEARKFAKMITFDKAEEMYEKCNIISTKRIDYDNSYINIFTGAYDKSSSLPKLMTTTDYWLKVNNVMYNIWNGNDVKTELDKLNSELDIQMH